MHGTYIDQEDNTRN